MNIANAAEEEVSGLWEPVDGKVGVGIFGIDVAIAIMNTWQL